MKLANIIEQIEFNKFEAMARVIYSEDANPKQLDHLLRALPGVTTVTNAGNNPELLSNTYKVALVSQKDAKEAFESFKSNAINKYSVITDVQIAEETIEDK